MITRALLIWLVTYVSLFATFGFVLYVARSFVRRGWSNGAILRTVSQLAFVGATIFWVLLVIVD